MNHFSIARYSVITVKTSVDSAKALGCVVVKEEVDKSALKRLYNEGVPVPDVFVHEAVRITEV